VPNRCISLAGTCILGLLIASVPIKFEAAGKSGLEIALASAHAKSGNSGSGGGGNSGSGGGGSGNSGSGSSGSDNSGSGSSSSGSGSDDGDSADTRFNSDDFSDGQRLGADKNMDLHYTNGWREWIRNGRYRLTDPKGRVVSERWARPDDLLRMLSTVEP
jgi:hypothetical protein